MGGINPILQLLLDAWRADPYNECAITSGSTHGSYTYRGEGVKFQLEFCQIGNNVNITGHIGNERVAVKVVEPQRCAVEIILPQEPGSETIEKIELVFGFSSEDQLHTFFNKRIEKLFEYANKES